jgi:putative transcriptional regulator
VLVVTSTRVFRCGTKRRGLMPYKRRKTRATSRTLLPTLFTGRLDSEREADVAKMRRISPVKALRQRLGMTQVEFAQAFGLPISTLRDWEQRRCTPDAPARALLRAIEREPETMRRLLSQAA